MLQDEINGLQVSLAEELAAESQESDPVEQLALQSTLTVLAERMSTIRMKAAGKRQLLEVTRTQELLQLLHLNQALGCKQLFWVLMQTTWVCCCFNWVLFLFSFLMSIF